MLNLFSLFRKNVPGNFSSNRIKPVVLLLLDGFGIAPESHGNAIIKAATPNLDRYRSIYPSTELIAAGESVGLPANEAGNSEVGHLTVGAGRVIYQSLPRINMSIEDGTFFENQAFIKAIRHVKANKSKLNLMGLISSGEVHSSNSHLYALLDLCRKNDITGVALHLFTDGRDAPPEDGVKVISQIEQKLAEDNIGYIASLSGRYYAMDRDARWERTKKTYDSIVSGYGNETKSIPDFVNKCYLKGITDEFIEPCVNTNIPVEKRTVTDNDAVIFFNFRIDRPRQLTMAFVFPDFENLKYFEFGYIPHEGKKAQSASTGPTFTREKIVKNMFFVTMTEYQKNIPVSAVAFPTSMVNNSLTEVISKNNIKQLHLAESEKERMVTYYLDGLRETGFKDESVVMVPSPKVSTYDNKPEMSVYSIVDEFKKALTKDAYGFFAMNFANPDMVAHTGNLEATVKAIEFVDDAVRIIVECALSAGGSVFISSDHGNAEELVTFPHGSFFFTSSAGSVNTEHSNSPVPFYIISNSLRDKMRQLPKGSLADIAPTILSFMKLTKPEEMTGRDLLNSGNV